jgi:protein tyrosine phosphatase (PTP) superfamily phosphohydrolase (DUF442 family)
VISPAYVELVDIEGIRSFVSLGDNLATAGQPTEDQLLAVRSHGFDTVVNLGLQDPRYCLPDEARTVGELGMSYHQIPVNFQNPTLTDFEAFQRVMRECRGRRLFVHCAANLRVSCFIALFGETDLGWTREQADAHIRRLWEPNEVWNDFLQKVRAGLVSGA